MVKFSYLWANLIRARTCLWLKDWLPLLHLWPNPTSLKARITVMSDNNLHVSYQSCFSIAGAIPSRPSITRVAQRLFSWFARSFGCPLLCLSISPLASFLKCTTKDWFMPTKVATLQVKTLLLNCTKAWCLCSWNNGGVRLQTILQIAPRVLWNQSYTMHKKSHNVLNYTMHTKMSMLKEWRQTKASIINPNHFKISYLKNPIFFSFFGFTFMYLIT